MSAHAPSGPRPAAVVAGALRFVVLLLALVAGSQAVAQETAPAPAASAQPTSPEAVDAMVARMSDDDVRALLLEHLKRTADAAGAQGTPDATLAQRVERLWGAFTVPVRKAIVSLPLLLAPQVEAMQTFVHRQGRLAATGALLALVAAIVAAGFAAERLLQRFVFRDTGAGAARPGAARVEAFRYGGPRGRAGNEVRAHRMDAALRPCGYG